MNTLPKEFPQFEESVYAGFGLRLGSILLDILITLPFFIGLGVLGGKSQTMYLVTLIIQFIFMVIYYVFFVKKYGATPGKYIAGITITKLDGTKADWNEAALRFLVDFCLSVFAMVLGYLAVMSMTNDEYQSLTFMTRGPRLQEYSPELFQVQALFTFIWVFSEPFVSLTNKHKRALHDYIGETLLIKRKYHKQVLEIVESNNEK